MRRVIVNEFDQLAEALSSYNAMFAYRMMNLCVKAEEVSLLSVQVPIEGQMQNLEKCATIAKDGDYDFLIIPKYDDDMMMIGQGILKAHPEFKQKIESTKVETADTKGNVRESDVHYIRVTMPVVDDDRYDVLKNGAKVCYEQCKAQMEAANLKADAVLADLCVGETKENLDLIKQERERLNGQWYGQRDKVWQDKLQEIEDAHDKWLAEQNEKEHLRQEDEAAHSATAAHSMKLESED